MNSGGQRIEERLAAHPFLKGIGMDHLKVLAQSAVPTHFEKDQLIFKAGEPANGFYLIESGTVALEGSVLDHGPITTDVVSAGEPLGWSWLFPPYLWHFDARATELTTALCFSGVLLRQHRDEDPALSHELFRRTCEVMARRLQAARRKLIAAKKPRETAK
jgi:CRP/FNR family transcriptional regulator, cyclic AMP receptor protein